MDYKEVDSEYLREKILANEYARLEIQKMGAVTARFLQKGEIVQTYFYDESAQIKKYNKEILGADQVLVTKNINGKHYNSVMNALTFCKTYTKTNKGSFIPVIDPFTSYIIDEKITFLNVWEQQMTMSPGDMLVPFNAKLQEFYGIYKYNFDDNYEMSHNKCYCNQPDLKPTGLTFTRRKI